MAEDSKIEWTDHTFNPWRLTSWMRMILASTFSNWNRLEVNSFVAVPTQREAVRYFKPKGRVISERLDVMGLEVASLSVTAVLAGITVPNINVVSPSLILGRSAVTLVSLVFSVAVGVVIFSACRPLSRDSRDSGFCLGGVKLSDPVAWPTFRRTAHLAS